MLLLYIVISEMGCHGCVACYHGRVGFAVIIVVVLFGSFSSFLAQGRSSAHFSGPFKRVEDNDRVREMAIATVKRIGSTPPRCDRKCSWCKRCEAIQVPMDPQESKQLVHGKVYGGGLVEDGKYYVGNDRGGDDGSNYKPMSWKCKCGEFIFNP